jgi:hypothetical protein
LGRKNTIEKKYIVAHPRATIQKSHTVPFVPAQTAGTQISTRNNTFRFARR